MFVRHSAGWEGGEERLKARERTDWLLRFLNGMLFGQGETMDISRGFGGKAVFYVRVMADILDIRYY